MPPRVKAPVAMIAATTWITSQGDCSASRSGTTGVYSSIRRGLAAADGDLLGDRLGDLAAGSPLGQVREHRQEVDDRARGHCLVAEHLELIVGHDDSPAMLWAAGGRAVVGCSTATSPSISPDRSPPALRSSPAT